MRREPDSVATRAIVCDDIFRCQYRGSQAKQAFYRGARTPHDLSRQERTEPPVDVGGYQQSVFLQLGLRLGRRSFNPHGAGGLLAEPFSHVFRQFSPRHGLAVVGPFVGVLSVNLTDGPNRSKHVGITLF